MPSLRRLLEDRLADADTSWSVGCFGVIAEFHWTREEVSRPIQPLGRESTRGSITIDSQVLESDVHGLAWELTGTHGGGWTQAFGLHLPSEAARMGGRCELARVGDDDEGAVYDIGIGASEVDACVVASDPELASVLDGSVGRSIWEDGNAALPAIKEASPTRLFRSRAAEVRVRQHIGSHTGPPTPNGPHTHVIRGLLRTVRSHDARIPVPEGRSLVLSMYPPHPARDELGKRKPFDRSQWESFQALLADFGPPGYASAKRELVGAASGEHACSEPPDPGLARVLMPQLAELGLQAERLDEIAEAWNLRQTLEGVRDER